MKILGKKIKDLRMNNIGLKRIKSFIGKKNQNKINKRNMLNNLDNC